MSLENNTFDGYTRADDMNEENETEKVNRDLMLPALVGTLLSNIVIIVCAFTLLSPTN